MLYYASEVFIVDEQRQHFLLQDFELFVSWQIFVACVSKLKYVMEMSRNAYFLSYCKELETKWKKNRLYF